MRAAPASEAFVDDVAAAFGRAADREHEVRTLSLAGRRVRVVAAGAGLAETYLRALASREVSEPGAARDADLTVHLWERATTGVAPPPPPWAPDDFLAGGRIRGHARDGIRVTYAGWARTLTVYDAPSGRAFVHLADRRAVPDWVLRAPMRNVITWWASDRGLAMVHAAAVAGGERAVVIAGPSGSGKSTTALACLAAGLRLLGDDACLVDLSTDPSGVLLVFPVYGLAKLERDALARLPELEALVVDRDADQLLVDPPGVPGSGVPLRAVLLSRIVARARTTLDPVSDRDALHTLVTSSLMEGEGAGGTTLGPLTRLVRAAECRRLELGSRREGVVRAVRRALGEG